MPPSGGNTGAPIASLDATDVSGGNGENSPSVSFVIPVLNDAERLQRCLQSIARSEYPAGRIEVIVVDNGSVDGSARVARQAGASVLELPGVRVGEMRNRGSELAHGEVLAFVDADHEIDALWVRCAIDALRGPDVAAVGALYHAPANGTWVQQMYDALRARPPGCCPVEWLASGNMAVWREAFRQVGGFDSTLETCEDVDFCQRLRARGQRVMSDERLKSVHFGDPQTLGQLFRSELWRGRDNLRVSLRGPLSLRGIPSVVTPVIHLALIGVAVAGLFAVSIGGLTFALIAATGLAGLASLRVARMVPRLRRVGPIAFGQAFMVASVYEVARALALIGGAPHRRRQGVSK